MSIGIGSFSGASAAAAAQASAAASGSFQMQASISVLKKANDLTGELANQLIASATGVGSKLDVSA